MFQNCRSVLVKRYVCVLSLYLFCLDAELIITKFWQLRRAEHRLVAHQERRRDFSVTVLGRVHIEHELPERALEPREAALQHHEARARQLRSGLEIHLPEPLAEIEMLLRREAVIALGTEAMMLDVAAWVLAVRHFGQRQIVDLRELVAERLGALLFFRLDC